MSTKQENAIKEHIQRIRGANKTKKKRPSLPPHPRKPNAVQESALNNYLDNFFYRIDDQINDKETERDLDNYFNELANIKRVRDLERAADSVTEFEVDSEDRERKGGGIKGKHKLAKRKKKQSKKKAAKKKQSKRNKAKRNKAKKKQSKKK